MWELDATRDRVTNGTVIKKPEAAMIEVCQLLWDFNASSLLMDLTLLKCRQLARSHNWVYPSQDVRAVVQGCEVRGSTERTVYT
jgi:hypothetical protein